MLTSDTESNELPSLAGKPASMSWWLSVLPSCRCSIPESWGLIAGDAPSVGRSRIAAHPAGSASIKLVMTSLAGDDFFGKEGGPIRSRFR
jgi:hypothetical protein